MITEVTVDGIYRPEKHLNQLIWYAVAYIPIRGKVNRKVHCECIRGQTIPLDFPSSFEAEKICNQLNNVQPDNEFTDWKDWIRAEQTRQQARDLRRELDHIGYAELTPKAGQID